MGKRTSAKADSKANQSTHAANFILAGALSQVEAATRLGLNRKTLCDWRNKGPIWVPAVSRPRFVLYPLRQVELLHAIMLGLITEETAWAEWSGTLSNITMAALGRA
jgi:hypothetical protein